MGKRELLLIGVFVLVGVAVYSITAPPTAPGSRGFSIGALLDHMRREVRGRQASAEVKSTTTLPLTPEVADVRFATEGAVLAIVGETRDDVLCELSVWSNGFDDAEAQKYASETKLKVSEGGASLGLAIDYPDPGQQRATLTVRMPSRLAVRINSRAKLDLTNVASAELADTRGQVTIRDVSGRVVVTHRGGTLTVEDVGSVKLSSRGSNVTLRGIKGEALLQTQSGELHASAPGGSIELEANNTKVTFDELTKMREPIRINAQGGRLTLAGVRTETRIDARDADVDVTIDQPAPVTIYNENTKAVRVTLPPGGVRIDALATAARLTVPDGLLPVKTTEHEQRASGAVNGGGPLITLRSSHGDIEIRPRLVVEQQ